MRGWLSLIAVLLAQGVWAPRLCAEDGVAFHSSVRSAREAAQKAGRPLFIALHWRSESPPEARWPADPEGWIDLYRDAAVVTLSSEFVCVARVLDASALAPGSAPLLLVLSPEGTVLLREEAWPHARGEESRRALIAFLEKGLRTFGPIPAGAPKVLPAHARSANEETAGGSSLQAQALPIDGDGLSIRLRWDFPVPELATSGSQVPAQELLGRLLLTWDGAGPFDLNQTLKGAAGDELDQTVEVRFADHPELEPLRTKGEHLLELWLEPLAGSFPFATGPLRVARVWVSLGDGGGGGGGSGEGEQNAPPPLEPPPPPPPPPTPAPEGADPQEAPPEDPGQRTEVVEPFVREGEEVRKEDAIVAVPDPEAGVKPPQRVPVQEVLRDLERQLEQAVREERVPPADRDFLRRYFEALRRRVGAESR